MNPDGSDQRALTSGDRWPGTALYSPDGRSIAFDMNRGDGTDLWLMPAGGGELRRVAKTEVEESLAGWLPDGSGLIYSAPEGDSDLVRVNVGALVRQ
jgi:Tol biopolymer transport system component